MPVILQFWLWFSGIAGLVLSAVVYNVCETLQVKYRAARDAKVGRPSVEGTDLFVTNPTGPTTYRLDVTDAVQRAIVKDERNDAGL